jgi:type I restriction enzyme S subunit
LGNGKIQTNDVLFCLRGSLGKFSCVEDLAEGAIASSLVILRPQECLVLEYLLAYLSSSQCANQIDTFKGGAAQPNLGAKDLKQFAIPLPPKNIQIEIASRLSVFKEHVDRLVSTYKEKLTALDDLKKSLLHQAFSGFL